MTDTSALTLNRSGQMELFGSPPVESSKVSSTERVFRVADPSDIYLCGARLDEHLMACGQQDPLRMRAFVQGLDWGPFEAQYELSGRAPYAPSVVLGLIVYGLLQGVSSLRGLENLARKDLGAMWITGGLFPDHASIGRFIQRHDELITGAWLREVTAKIVDRLQSDMSTVAGDGTVVQAAASRYRTVRQEAINEKASRMRREAEAQPDDAALERQARRAEQVRNTLQERNDKRSAKGAHKGELSIAPSEPDAVVQPLKTKEFAASYKPSVLANRDRLIVGWAVHPSSETAVMVKMLDDAARCGPMETALFDAGYRSRTVISGAVERGIDMLCPTGRIDSDGKPVNRTGPYHKSRFTYVSERDQYQCPEGHWLTFDHRGTSPRGGPYRLYRAVACADCPVRDQCTTSQRGRQIKRYSIDTQKEHMRQRLEDPQARERYKQRAAMVEPVFSVLRMVQGLQRFRRFGLAGVRREFGLHVLAYNMGRMLALASFWRFLFCHESTAWRNIAPSATRSS